MFYDIFFENWNEFSLKFNLKKENNYLGIFY